LARTPGHRLRAEYAIAASAASGVHALADRNEPVPDRPEFCCPIQHFNIAVRGVFDHCQDLVKAVSNNAEFKARYAMVRSLDQTGRG